MPVGVAWEGASDERAVWAGHLLDWAHAGVEELVSTRNLAVYGIFISWYLREVSGDCRPSFPESGEKEAQKRPHKMTNIPRSYLKFGRSWQTHLGGLVPAVAHGLELEFDGLLVAQAAETLRVDVGLVHEHVADPVVARHEACGGARERTNEFSEEVGTCGGPRSAFFPSEVARTRAMREGRCGRAGSRRERQVPE